MSAGLAMRKPLGFVLFLLLGATSQAGAADYGSVADLSAAVMPSFVNIYNRSVAKIEPEEGAPRQDRSDQG